MQYNPNDGFGRLVGLALIVGGVVLLSLPTPFGWGGRSITTGILFLVLGVGHIFNPNLLWGESKGQQPWRWVFIAVAVIVLIVLVVQEASR